MGKNLPVVKYNFLTACQKPINFIKTKRRISCGNTKRNRRIFCCLEQKKNLYKESRITLAGGIQHLSVGFYFLHVISILLLQKNFKKNEGKS